MYCIIYSTGLLYKYIASVLQEPYRCTSGASVQIFCMSVLSVHCPYVHCIASVHEQCMTFCTDALHELLFRCTVWPTVRVYCITYCTGVHMSWHGGLSGILPGWKAALEYALISSCVSSSSVLYTHTGSSSTAAPRPGLPNNPENKSFHHYLQYSL